jgi:hypothetical protein
VSQEKTVEVEAGVGRAIQKYIDTQTAQYPECRVEGWRLLAEQIVRAVAEKDVPTLLRWLNMLNPGLRRLFSDVTGLPSKTLKQTRASISYIDPDGFDAAGRRSEEARIERDGIRKKNAIMRTRARPMLLASGQRTTFGEWVDEQVKKGFTILRERPVGHVKSWQFMGRGQSIFYPIRRRDEMLVIEDALKREG